MKYLILVFLFTINLYANASPTGKIKLMYELTTLDDPVYESMMNHIEIICGNSECESFSISSASMAPTFLKNDVVLVNKNSYLVAKPQRGDIMVFKYPRNPKIPYVFRVIGLPGDHIA